MNGSSIVFTHISKPYLNCVETTVHKGVGTSITRNGWFTYTTGYLQKDQPPCYANFPLAVRLLLNHAQITGQIYLNLFAELVNTQDLRRSYAVTVLSCQNYDVISENSEKFYFMLFYTYSLWLFDLDTSTRHPYILYHNEEIY